MQRREFLVTGTLMVFAGWLGIQQPRLALAATPKRQFRRTDAEIYVLLEGEQHWQVTLRVREGMRVGRVWQKGDLLCARIHNGVHSFVLTSSDGSLWKNS